MEHRVSADVVSSTCGQNISYGGVWNLLQQLGERIICQDGIKNLEKVMVDYSTDMTKIVEMVQGVTKSVVDLGLSMIAKEWENYDKLLRTRKELRSGWYIVRRDESTLLTSLGSVTYHKTLFQNQSTGEYEYLLNRIMGIENIPG